jgi:hypothetical protein
MHKIRTIVSSTALAFLVTTSNTFCANANRTDSASPSQNQSCKTFVRGFYDWYTAYSKKHDTERSSDSALKLRANYFAPALTKQLREDSAAQDKVSGEIVGLDFDPFLNTNGDPYDKYVVGEVTVKGANYFVNVYGSNKNKRSAKPEIVPELALNNGRWVFTNFHYGNASAGNENLIQILKELRVTRAKQ